MFSSKCCQSRRCSQSLQTSLTIQLMLELLLDLSKLLSLLEFYVVLIEPLWASTRVFAHTHPDSWRPIILTGCAFFLQWYVMLVGYDWQSKLNEGAARGNVESPCPWWQTKRIVKMGLTPIGSNNSLFSTFTGKTVTSGADYQYLTVLCVAVFLLLRCGMIPSFSHLLYSYLINDTHLFDFGPMFSSLFVGVFTCTSYVPFIITVLCCWLCTSNLVLSLAWFLCPCPVWMSGRRPTKPQSKLAEDN